MPPAWCGSEQPGVDRGNLVVVATERGPRVPRGGRERARSGSIATACDERTRQIEPRRREVVDRGGGRLAQREPALERDDRIRAAVGGKLGLAEADERV